MTINKLSAVIVGIIILSITAYLIMRNGSTGDNGELAIPSSSASASDKSPASGSGVVQEYDYTEAPKHIGERAIVHGTVVKTFTAKSGVTFFDFCQGFDSCPFSAVVFSSDAAKFGDFTQYERSVKITGVIRSYQGSAEIVLSDPDQVK